MKNKVLKLVEDVLVKLYCVYLYMIVKGCLVLMFYIYLFIFLILYKKN